MSKSKDENLGNQGIVTTEPKRAGLKAQQAESTRNALLDAGQELFTAQGFADTPAEALVKQAGVTRGALYHHFRDKRDLFLAVFDRVEARLTKRMAAVAAEHDHPIEALHAGVDEFLDACLEPDIRRITLIDAPSVLGWQTWRAIDAKYALGLIQGVLELAMEKGHIKPEPVTPLAHLLLGAVVEAAMVIGHADDGTATRKLVGESCHRFVDKLSV